MKLYYSPGACSLTVRIVLNEMEQAFEFEAVDLKTKQTQSGKNFLDINPKGQVPTLVLDNQEVLTENIVILQYLAEKHTAYSLLPPVGEMKRYRILEWLVYISTELHKGFGPFFNPMVPEEIREQIFKPLLKRKFKYIEERLTNSYLMGETFTLPDAYLFVMLSWLNAVKLSISEWPSLSAYFDRLKQRNSIQKSLKQEGILH